MVSDVNNYSSRCFIINLIKCKTHISHYVRGQGSPDINSKPTHSRFVPLAILVNGYLIELKIV